MLFRYVFLFIFWIVCGCQHDFEPLKISQGIQSPYEGYLPARIAILNCQSVAGSVLSSKKICEKIDNFIFLSLKEQKFVRAYSPKSVEKKLTKKNNLDLLEKIPVFWSKGLLGSTYKASLKTNPEWVVWLSKISQACSFCDAVLLPIVFENQEEHQNDRGMLISTRKIVWSFFLIDVETADIIWFRQKKSSKSQKKLSKRPYVFPPYPSWKFVLQDLVHESLWERFPGYNPEFFTAS